MTVYLWSLLIILLLVILVAIIFFQKTDLAEKELDSKIKELEALKQNKLKELA